VSSDWLVWEFEHLGVIRCDRVKTPEVPKSRVNLDRSSKETHVSRLASSGIQRLGVIRCDRVKTPEVPKSGVHLDHSLKETCVRRSYYLEFDVRENWSVLVWNLLKPQSPRSEVEESKWCGMMTSPGVMWTFPRHAMCHHLNC
jgi:hypothetical protein